MKFGCGGFVLNVLLIAFILLKVLAVQPIAAWSWWAVLIPLWIEIGICALAFIIFILCAIFASK